MFLLTSPDVTSWHRRPSDQPRKSVRKNRQRSRSASASAWGPFWPPVLRPRLRPPRAPGGPGRVPIAGWSLGGVGRIAGPSKQPLMVRNLLKVYMELGSSFVSARTNNRHHHQIPADQNAMGVPGGGFGSGLCRALNLALSTCDSLAAPRTQTPPLATRGPIVAHTRACVFIMQYLLLL